MTMRRMIKRGVSHRQGENNMKQRKSKLFWQAIAAVLMLVLIKPALADCDYMENSDLKSPLYVNAPLVSSHLTVGPDVPVGTVLYTQNFNPAFRTIWVGCTEPQSYVGTYINHETLPHPLSSWSGNFGKVYETGLPGVGVFIDNYDLDFELPMITGGTGVLDHHGWSANGYKYRIRLIKIGEVQPGVITGADLPCWINKIGPIAEPFISMRLCFTGAINVVSQTCTTPDVFVSMGKYDMGRYFRGKGSVTEWQDASIRLLNCPKFYGSAETYYSRNGDSGTTSTTGNSLTLSLTPNTAVIDDANGIMSVKEGSGSAGGVGIQLEYGASSPQSVRFSRAIKIPLPVTTPSAFTIPLRARYIQTGPTVTPGAADATVTFNINYF